MQAPWSQPPGGGGEPMLTQGSVWSQCLLAPVVGEGVVHWDADADADADGGDDAGAGDEASPAPALSALASLALLQSQGGDDSGSEVSQELVGETPAPPQPCGAQRQPTPSPPPPGAPLLDIGYSISPSPVPEAEGVELLPMPENSLEGVAVQQHHPSTHTHTTLVCPTDAARGVGSGTSPSESVGGDEASPSVQSIVATPDDPDSFRVVSEALLNKSSIAVVLGAGVSVAAGYQAYRSKGGLYTDTRVAQLEGAIENLFSIKFFKRRPGPFLRYFTECLAELRQPTEAHRLLAALDARGKIRTILTQNFDGLEGRAGATSTVQMHGSLSRTRCVSCKKTFAISYFKRLLNRGEVPRCLYCVGRSAPLLMSALKERPCSELPDIPGLVKPDIVFYGEDAHIDTDEVAKDLREADALLVMGTSLRVNPICWLLNSMPKKTKKVIIDINACAVVADHEALVESWAPVIYEGDCQALSHTLRQALEEAQPLPSQAGSDDEDEEEDDEGAPAATQDPLSQFIVPPRFLSCRAGRGGAQRRARAPAKPRGGARGGRKKAVAVVPPPAEDEDEDEEEAGEVSAPEVKKGGRAAQNPRGGGGGRGKQKAVVPVSKGTRGGARGQQKKAAPPAAAEAAGGGAAKHKRAATAEAPAAPPRKRRS